jgi:hypothetical protein
MNMRRAILRVALITILAGSASAQGGMTSTGTQTPGALTVPGTTSRGTTTSPGTGLGTGLPSGVPQAPVGHRQPTATDVPALKPPTSTTSDQTITPTTPTTTTPSIPTRGRSAQSRGGGGGGPPVLQVVTSCEAAGRGAVVLGRNKEACLADETAAQDTLKQNWAKYAANDKTQCVGMARTGGPASYVELLSCLEIMRDARQIQNADPLRATTRPPRTRPRPPDAGTDNDQSSRDDRGRASRRAPASPQPAPSPDCRRNPSRALPLRAMRRVM